MINRLLFWGLVVIFSIPAQSALAGSLSVTPTRVYLDSEAKSTTVRLTNRSDGELSVQVEMFKWTQDSEGNDLYEPTNDVIFFPKILKINVNSEKIIRIGFRGKRSVAKEKSYRMYVTQLPKVKPGFQGVQVLIRMGVPVFIVPSIKNAVISPAIENVEVKKGELIVRLKNNGVMHYIPKMIVAAGYDSSGEKIFHKDIHGWYILPGYSRPFTADIPEKECLKIKSIDVSVKLESKSLDKKISIDSASCAK